MILIRFPKVALMAGMALLVIGLPVLADELRGTVKSVDGENSRMVVHDELAQRDVVVNFNRLTTLKSGDRSLSTLKDLRPGAHVSIMDSLTASKVTVEETSVVAAERRRPGRSSPSSGTTSGTTSSNPCCFSSTSDSLSPFCGSTSSSLTSCTRR